MEWSVTPTSEVDVVVSIEQLGGFFRKPPSQLCERVDDKLCGRRYGLPSGSLLMIHIFFFQPVAKKLVWPWPA